jgi:WD40 repeat protein
MGALLLLFARSLLAAAQGGGQLPTLDVLSPQNAARIQEVARLGDGIIGQIIWSGDGRTLAASSSIGVYLFSASKPFQADTTVPPRLLGSAGGAIAFSPDGHLLGVGQYQKAELWDVASGKRLAELPVENTVSTMAFNPSSTRLAIGTLWWDGCSCTVDVWDISRSDKVPPTKIASLKADTNTVCRTLFSPDGQFLLSFGCPGKILIWTTEAFWPVVELPLGANDVSVDISPNGKYLTLYASFPTSCCSATIFSLWNINSLLHDVKGRRNALVGLGPGRGFEHAFTSDNALVAVYTGNEQVALYQLGSGQELARLRADKVQALAFARDNHQLYAVNQDGSVWAWDVAQALRDGMDRQAHPIVTAANQDEAERILEGFEPPVETLNGETLGLKGHQSPVESLTFAPDNESLFSAEDYEMSLVWNIQTGGIIHRFDGGEANYGWGNLSSDGRIFASNGYSSVSIWDTQSGEQLQKYETPDEKVLSSALSANQLAVVSSKNGVAGDHLSVWDTKSSRLLTSSTIYQRHDWWHSLEPSYSADGTLLAFTSRDETGNPVARVMDTTAWREVARLANSNNELPLDVQFAPQGNSLAVLWPGRPPTLEIWDVGKTPPTRLRQFETVDAEGIRFSPDGSLIAIRADQSKFVRLMDAQNGKILASIPVNRLTSLAFSRDSRLLALGLSDGTVRLYGVKA